MSSFKMAIDSGGLPGYWKETMASKMADSSSDWESDSSADLVLPGVPLVQNNQDTPLYNAGEVTEDVRSYLNQRASQDSPKSQDSSQVVKMAARAYQVEMFQKSLAMNIIIMMETGSGKTQVALMRIQRMAEESNKICWFIAPTVALASQQTEVIRSQLPSLSTRLLVGTEDLDSWSSIEVWKQALDGHDVIVSTPQVLSDALDHAFVHIQNIGLLVFDEVHNCVGNSPGSKIMRNHYHPTKAAGLEVPRILGLSASPSMNAAFKKVEILETLMDSVCCTPVVHKEDLLLHTPRPTMEYIKYEQQDVNHPSLKLRAFEVVRNACKRYNVNDDPMVKALLASPNKKNAEKLNEVVKNRDTHIWTDVKSLGRRVEVIYHKVGAWGADMYMSQIISRIRAASNRLIEQPLDFNENKYLNHLIGDEPYPAPPTELLGPDTISPKMQCLIDYLLQVPDGTQGIIFASERTTVLAIGEILSVHPQVSKIFKTKTVFGFNSAHQRGVWDPSMKHPLSENALQDFRDKRINILVSTTVLEEGIDVPACNLVVCFDPPPDFKSFVQRRGRARSQKSRLVIMIPNDNDVMMNWEQQERILQTLYEDEDRQMFRMEQLESDIEAEEASAASKHYHIIPETGSRIDMTSSKSHLHHFCAVTIASEFVDSRPDYIYEQIDTSEGTFYRATVMLPTTLPMSIRIFKSLEMWKSQKNASNDVSLVACLKLYDAGFLNKHWLPLSMKDFVGSVDLQSSVIEIQAVMSPWPSLAESWLHCQKPSSYEVTIRDGAGRILADEQYFSLPFYIDHMESFPAYIDYETKWTVEIKPTVVNIDIKELDVRDHTVPLVTLAYGHRTNLLRDESRTCLVRFWSPKHIVRMSDIGSNPLTLDLLQPSVQFKSTLRDKSLYPFEFLEYLPSKPPPEQVQSKFRGFAEAPENAPYIALRSKSRRTDYQHRLLDEPIPTTSTKRWKRVIPLEWVTYDNVPQEYQQMGMLIPSIINEVEMCMISKILNDTKLARLKIKDLRLVRTAISARSSNSGRDYERLEFLGDSMLKFMTCLNVSAEKLDWPEGYLSMRKDGLVSNFRLHLIALGHQMEQFLVTHPFTGRRWYPPFMENSYKLQAPPNGRTVAVKTLADIIEALIGAVYIDGGIHQALHILSILYKDKYEWMSEPHCRYEIYKHAPETAEMRHLHLLEQVLGYTFTKKSLLLESITHASYISPGLRTRSMDRLEFLGDAVIDRIIVNRLFNHKPLLPNHMMHTLKSALVNSDFLSYMCLSWGVEVNVGGDRFERRSLWNFMQKTSYSMTEIMKSTLASHDSLHDNIEYELWHGTHYPWALLAEVQARKFYCDIFEAVIGAMYVDSGSIEPCAQFLECLGFFKLIDRLLADNVQVVHPKERLSRLAYNLTVVYAIKPVDSKSIRCLVFVGDVCWADVSGPVGKDVIKVSAAHEACLNMDKRTPLMGRRVEDAMDLS